MKKRSVTYLVWVIAGLSFLFACAEGWFYYSEFVQFQPFQLLLIAQNAIKTFLFSPAITADKVLSAMTEDISAVERMVHYVYLVAVFLAPLCTGCALWTAFERQLRRIFHLLLVKREEILIFGHNAQVKCLLSHETSQQARKQHGRRPRICLITDEAISAQEELHLLRRGVTFYHADCLGMDAPARSRLFSALGFPNFKTVFLFDGSSSRNLSLYLMLLEHYGANPSHFGDRVTIYSSCDTQAVRRLYGEMHDQMLERLLAHGQPAPKLDLVLFSIPELKTNHMFSRHPLHICNVTHAAAQPDPRRPECWNVHLLIAGFGSNGQQVLSQAIGCGVFHSGSSILVDIFDRDMDRRKELFLRCFDADCIQHSADGGTVTLRSELADGSLALRFHKTDLCGLHFAAQLRGIQSEAPLTYAAVCVNDTDVSVHCLTALKHLKTALQHAGLPYADFPVVLNLEQDEPVAQFLDRDEGGYRDVFSICSNAEILRIDHIVNSALEQQARRYHQAYQRIQLRSVREEPTPAPDLGWDKLALFQRDANRFLYRHDAVKRAVLQAQNFHVEQVLQALGIGEDHCYEGTHDALLQRLDSSPEAQELVALEHRRWCYTMAMQGWAWAREKDPDTLKTPYLTAWAALRADFPHMCLYDLIPYLVPAAGSENILSNDQSRQPQASAKKCGHI